MSGSDEALSEVAGRDLDSSAEECSVFSLSPRLMRRRLFFPDMNPDLLDYPLESLEQELQEIINRKYNVIKDDDLDPEGGDPGEAMGLWSFPLAACVDDGDTDADCLDGAGQDSNLTTRARSASDPPGFCHLLRRHNAHAFIPPKADVTSGARENLTESSHLNTRTVFGVQCVSIKEEEHSPSLSEDIAVVYPSKSESPVVATRAIHVTVGVPATLALCETDSSSIALLEEQTEQPEIVSHGGESANYTDTEVPSLAPKMESASARRRASDNAETEGDTSKTKLDFGKAFEKLKEEMISLRRLDKRLLRQFLQLRLAVVRLRSDPGWSATSSLSSLVDGGAYGYYDQHGVSEEIYRQRTMSLLTPRNDYSPVTDRRPRSRDF